MAVDVFSENFVGMISPRLSFSRDLDENETSSTNINDYSCQLDRSFVDSAFDFAFNVDATLTFQSSSADELFSDGKIVPTRFKNEEEVKKSEEVVERVPVIPCLDHPSATITDTRKKSLKEFLEDSIEEEEEEDNNAAVAAKSFWKFRRSNSLNCDRNQRKGLIGSWKILSRSGSTGKFLEKIVEEEKPSNFHSKLLRKFSRNNSLSNCSDNGNNVSTINNKVLMGSTKMLRRSHSTSDHYFSKSDSSLFRRSNSTGSAPNKLKKQQSLKQQQQNQNVCNGKSSQKGKVKDNNSRNNYGYGNNYNNNLRINPVLNLPSPYISRVSVDLFSFGSLFCNNGSKDRKKKK